MSLKFQFDAAGNPVMPTLILARHSGYKMGTIVAPYNMHLTDVLREAPEFSFTVSKDQEPLWKDIVDFKLIYVMEWDTWLQIKVDLIDGFSITKNVTAQGICKSELSQILLHGLEFNTDDDIAMDDYKRRIIYDPWDKDASILSSVLDKAPHYKLVYVDSTIASQQKTFSFDGVSIDDALTEICDECGAIIIYNDGTNEETGLPAREISIYDLETNCLNKDCKYRGEFSDVCPQCGGTDIKYGYGQDTTIFVSKEMLTNEVQYTSDIDSIKNTFKLEAGDDIMTAAIRACNPNGTDYIQYINEDTKRDMPEELVEKINTYEDLFQYYQTEYVLDLDDELVKSYNDLVDIYKDYNVEAKKIGYNDDGAEIILKGYPSLMNLMYDVIDFETILQSGLMPVDKNTETTAQAEAAKLTQDNIGAIALDTKYDFDLTIVNSLVLSMASYVVDKRYAVKIIEDDSNHIVDDQNGTHRWTGKFRVYDPNNDLSVESDQVTLELNTITETYVKNRIKKIMAATEDTNDHTVSHLLDVETPLDEFEDEIKWFNIDELNSIKDTCMSCMDTLQISGMANKVGKTQQQINNYDYYMNYYDKLNLILDEIVNKENELNNIVRKIENHITDVRNRVQDELNFENYLGTDLYKIFCSYRREDIYRNENYISDGLNNAEIFQNAREFYDTARKEIYKSAVLQHSITSTLKNLLVIPEFEPLRDYFELGNWIRVQVDDEIYRLRFIRYEVDYGNLPEINIEFSDVTRVADGISDLQSLLNKSQSMATSYGAVMHQMNSIQSTKVSVSNWLKNGFDATKTKIVNDDGKQDVLIDNHGILVRTYDDVTETYNDTQMKFINSTLAITDDGWKSIKTALGNIIYQDPQDGNYYETYGLIAETLVGDLILGRELKIYNDSQNMTFDDNGLRMSNGMNNVVINPNSENILTVSSVENGPMLWFDEKGMLHIEGGDGAGLDISTNEAITGIQTQFQVTANEIRGEIYNVNNDLRTILNQTADQIRAEVLNESSQLSAALSVLEGTIRGEVSDAIKNTTSLIEQTADRIDLEVKDTRGQIKQLQSDLSITSGEIRGEVRNNYNEINSVISQKENSIRSEVNDTKDGLTSYIEQTKDSIESNVRNANAQIYSQILQTDKDIRSTVANEIALINTQIVQNDSEIKGIVQNEVNKLSSMIYQNDSSIKLLVTNGLDELQSSITVNADKIESLVGDTSRIEQMMNRIILNVGTSSIELTDNMINAVAEKINLYGLITFKGLSQGARMVLDGLRDDIDRIDIGLKDVVTYEQAQKLIATESGHAVYYSTEDPPIDGENDEYSFVEGDIWYKEIENPKQGNKENTLDTHMKCFVRIGNTWVERPENEVMFANGTITADMLAADAVTAYKISGNQLSSINYEPPLENDSDYEVGFAKRGSLFDLRNGGISTRNFVVKNTSQNGNDEVTGGEVYIRGTIYANELILGDNVTIPANKVDVDWTQYDVNLDGYVTEDELRQATEDFITINDVPASMTQAQVVDIITNYNSLVDANTSKLVTDASIGNYITSSQTTDANGVVTKTISVNGTVKYTETRHPDSDFLILEVPIVDESEDEQGNPTHSVVVQKNGYLNATNALISGTIYATDGEFSGTLKAAKIEALDNSFDGAGDEQAKQTTITYKNKSIVHQLINDQTGTMYRAVLGKAGNFHLQGNIYFAQPVDGSDNADNTKNHGYNKLQGHWLGDIIKGMQDQIATLSGDTEYTEITVDWTNVLNKPYDILFRLNNSGHSATLQGDGDFNLSNGNFYVPEGCTYKIGDNSIQDIFATKSELSSYPNSEAVAKLVEDAVGGVTCSSIGAATSDHHHTEIHNSNFHFEVTNYGFSCRDGCLTANTYIKAKGADDNSDGLIADVGNINAKDGNVYGKNISGSSDERMKNIIQPIDDSYLKVFRDLTPIVFDWKSNVNQHHFGLGAQTTKKIFEDNGHCDFDIAHYYQSNDSYYINYNDLSALTMYAAQHNMDNIEKLQEKLTYMEKENKVLKKYISELADKIERLSAKIN